MCPTTFQVFQVTLRDLSEVQGGLHRINVYFYDSWAEKYCRLSPGECIAVSGPAESLVRSDPSAGSGDHPLCLIFQTADNDDVGGPGGASADEVKCALVTNSGDNAGQTGKEGGPARRRDGRRRPGRGARGGTEAGSGEGSGVGPSTRSGVKQGGRLELPPTKNEGCRATTSQHERDHGSETNLPRYSRLF